MTVDVDIKALRGLPKFFDRMGDDAKSIKDWLDKPTDFGSGLSQQGGMINQLSGGITGAHNKVVDFFEKLDTKTAKKFSEAIDSCITHYEKTDDKGARDIADKKIKVDDDRIDGIHSGLNQMLQRPSAANRPSSTFGNAEDPFKSSKEVCATDGVFAGQKVKDYSGDYEYTPMWYDVASVTMIVRDIVWKTCKKDIFEDLVKPLTGDWNKVRAAADYYKGASEALLAMSTNMSWAIEGTRTVWQANASEAAQIKMSDLSIALTDAANALDTASDLFKEAADHMNASRGVLSGMFGEIIDFAIAAAAAGGATAASSWTGIGLLIGGSVTALAVGALIKAVHSYVAFCSRMDTFFVNKNGLLLAQMGGDVEEFELPKLPDSGPQVPA